MVLLVIIISKQETPDFVSIWVSAVLTIIIK